VAVNNPGQSRYNEERPHYALNLLSPMQFLEQQHLCNMYWRHTENCAFYEKGVNWDFANKQEARDAYRVT